MSASVVEGKSTNCLLLKDRQFDNGVWKRWEIALCIWWVPHTWHVTQPLQLEVAR